MHHWAGKYQIHTIENYSNKNYSAFVHVWSWVNVIFNFYSSTIKVPLHCAFLGLLLYSSEDIILFLAGAMTNSAMINTKSNIFHHEILINIYQNILFCVINSKNNTLQEKTNHILHLPAHLKLWVLQLIGNSKYHNSRNFATSCITIVTYK